MTMKKFTTEARQHDSEKFIREILHILVDRRRVWRRLGSAACKVDGLAGSVTFGMSYQVTDYNAYSKPTKITFEDGLTATLAWAGGTQLQTITGSNGEKITIKYNENGTVKGRTVTRA